MDDAMMKVLDELGHKVSKKVFVFALVVVWIIQFDISQSLFVPIVKETWIGWILLALIYIAIHYLIKKSEKEGVRQYIECLTDDKYDVSCDEITLSIINYKKYNWNPRQEIILHNTSSKEIIQISGHIDFYRNDINSGTNISTQNIHFRGRFIKRWILRKNGDFSKEKVLKTNGFQDSVVEKAGSNR